MSGRLPLAAPEIIHIELFQSHLLHSRKWLVHLFEYRITLITLIFMARIKNFDPNSFTESKPNEA
jgi:hypothetical protein